MVDTGDANMNKVQSLSLRIYGLEWELWNLIAEV